MGFAIEDDLRYGCWKENTALIIVSANFPRQAGRARVFLEERQAV
jgi:hypothetical protein